MIGRETERKGERQKSTGQRNSWEEEQRKIDIQREGETVT